jgi:hypothetical protein
MGKFYTKMGGKNNNILMRGKWLKIGINFGWI